MTNKLGTVFYTGVTSNLVKRVYEHKQLVSGFTAKYYATKLVYFELFNDIRDAISREKQIKSGPRIGKIRLIKKNNSQFKDLYDVIV